jgi:hypothetical protein
MEKQLSAPRIESSKRCRIRRACRRSLKSSAIGSLLLRGRAIRRSGKRLVFEAVPNAQRTLAATWKPAALAVFLFHDQCVRSGMQDCVDTRCRYEIARFEELGRLQRFHRRADIPMEKSHPSQCGYQYSLSLKSRRRVFQCAVAGETGSIGWRNGIRSCGGARFVAHVASREASKEASKRVCVLND